MNISSVGFNTAAGTAVAVAPATPPKQSAEVLALTKAVATINTSRVLGDQDELTFVFDRVTHRAVTRVVDRTTAEVVMQIPAEYVLRLAADLEERQKQGSTSILRIF